MEARIGEIQGEQALVGECYMQELKSGGAYVRTVDAEVPPPPPIFLDQGVKTQDEEMQVEPNEPLELVALHLEQSETTTRVGTRLQPKSKKP